MSKPRHVVLITRVLPQHNIGGMQAIAWDLARTFARSGNKVTVLTAEVTGRPSSFVEEGVHVVALPGTSWRRYGARWWRESELNFRRDLAAECDALLSVSAAGFGLLRFRKEFPKIPFVMQSHGTSLGEVRSKWKTRSPKALLSSLRNLVWLVKDLCSYGRFDAIAAVGEVVAEELHTMPISWALAAERVHTIPNGIDTERFSPNPVCGRVVREKLGWQGAKVVVSASRLHRQKGVHHGLDAFSLLEKMQGDVRYLIVGDGPERTALEVQAEKLGLTHKVHFTGAVSRDELPQYLQAADAMLFTTTRVEGLPLNVLEALAVGLPAVVSKHLFQNDALAESSHIFRVKQSEAASVAEGLVSALRIAELSISALPREYSLAECANSYLELFERISEQKSAVNGTSSLDRNA